MSQTNPAKVSNPRRIDSVDIVKGIAIILMVFGHTEQGAHHRGLWEGMPALTRGIAFADAFIYSFHMPAFFFVTGLFLAGSVERRGGFSFIMEKVKTILYPYVLWGLIFALTAPLTQRFRMGELVSWQFRLSAIVTGNSSWFLISLFICQLLALAVIRLPNWAQMTLAMAVCLLIPSSDITVFYMPFLFFPFVVAGIWIGSRRIALLEKAPRIFAWLGFGAFLILQLGLIEVWGPTTRWDMVPIGLTGIAMLLFLSRGILGTTGAAVLRWVGEASLAIFLISPFLQGFGRELVVRLLHTTNPVPYLGIPVLCATIIPALLWHWQDRLGIGCLFRWPAPKGRKALAEPRPAI
jgi:fucose 4-O-acetylase-like acetyltransferase